MTFTEDFLPSGEGKPLRAAPNYPTVFGVTFTPDVISILVAVLGLAGFLYLIFTQVIPAWQKHQDLEATQSQKQAEIQQKQTELAQGQKFRTELAQTKQQQTEVLSLFANEDTLDTLLLDLNRLVEADNAKVSGNGIKAKLTKYVPVVDPSNGVIVDSSLGPEVNGKLKSRVVNVGVEGTFAQTESILSDIERLQSLLIVKDYQSTLPQTPLNQQGRGPQTISTSFQLQALVPLSPEEVTKAAAAASAASQPPK